MMDETSAWDDLLREVHHHCTCCGAGGRPLVWANVVALPGLPALAVVLCRRCHSDPETPDVLGALLHQRYSAFV